MNNVHYFSFHITDNSSLIDVITEMNILNKVITPFVRFAIKADKSPNMPPPNAITQSDLLKLSFRSCSIILFDVSSSI